jgi:ABC-type arginine/histidine transport system permease subunit
MTALAVVIARALFKESFQTINLKLVALFCGTGLLASLLLIAYGLAFGTDFF